MPELPEVEIVRRSLEPHMVGSRVVAVDAKPVRLREGIRPRDWERRIVGDRVTALERRGKYLIAKGERAAALFHLGMSGRMVVRRPSDPRAPHTHLVLTFDHGGEVRFIDPRRFGVAAVVALGRLASHPALARLGPDPLGGDAGDALAAARTSRSPIRSILLDQTVLAGVGNIYANEALARAGISPLRRASAISEARLAALAGALREVLTEALDVGGTTLRDGGFVNADGDGGYFALRLSVYGREGEACGRCGGAIVRRVLTGRSVFYCPRCQR
ncbi:MAG TPA: bifunctional DNA-formamidopyrimidine glycosylase/DNA-(apurinic or apyrimidinic site) lyase [Thermoanaerobaculaceae bacterium]|nr:bifunctional DNA-formamidopyrimidine glycosylase/DNA-(apurinic or apyrimidinic site) lyase [Thermoanaerobaculaceae bacterium]